MVQRLGRGLPIDLIYRYINRLTSCTFMIRPAADDRADSQRTVAIVTAETQLAAAIINRTASNSFRPVLPNQSINQSINFVQSRTQLVTPYIFKCILINAWRLCDIVSPLEWHHFMYTVTMWQCYLNYGKHQRARQYFGPVQSEACLALVSVSVCN